MSKKLYVNEPPKKKLPVGATRDAVKIDFARRLQAAMVRKNWNQSDLARRASAKLKDDKIGRDNISGYIRGIAIPQPSRLKALADVLGVEVQDLLPVAPQAAQKAPPFDIKQLENGNVWLRVNQAVPFDTALQIMALINESREAVGD